MKLPSPKALNADVALHYFLNEGAPQLLYHKDYQLRVKFLPRILVCNESCYPGSLCGLCKVGGTVIFKL